MPVRVKRRIWPWPSRRDSQVKKAAKKSALKKLAKNRRMGGFFFRFFRVTLCWGIRPFLAEQVFIREALAFFFQFVPGLFFLFRCRERRFDRLFHGKAALPAHMQFMMRLLAQRIGPGCIGQFPAPSALAFDVERRPDMDGKGVGDGQAEDEQYAAE